MWPTVLFTIPALSWTWHQTSVSLYLDRHGTSSLLPSEPTDIYSAGLIWSPRNQSVLNDSWRKAGQRKDMLLCRPSRHLCTWGLPTEISGDGNVWQKTKKCNLLLSLVWLEVGNRSTTTIRILRHCGFILTSAYPSRHIVLSGRVRNAK